MRSAIASHEYARAVARPFSPSSLRRLLSLSRRVSAAASSERIGKPSDQILLYCFHYDPSTNRYSLRILRVVRFAGALTAMLLCGFIFVMVRREKRT